MSAPAVGRPPPTTAVPNVEITHDDGAHKHRRRFIGPLPESVVSQVVDGPSLQRGWSSFWSQHNHRQEDEDASVKDAIEEHALQFFLGHGGREEDWDETTERHIRDEMLRRWRQSEWGRLLRKTKDAQTNKRWVGTSFDIGVFLGVDMMNGKRRKPMEDEETIQDQYSSTISASHSTAEETFVTAQSHRSPPVAGPSKQSTYLQANVPQGGAIDYPSDEDFQRPISADSSTALLPPRIIVEDHSDPVHSNVAPHAPIEVTPLTLGASDTNLLSSRPTDKGKRKDVHVHYEDTLSNEEAPLDETPAPVNEVLARSGTEVEHTSAGAVEHVTPENQVNCGDIVMRDRMLVRVSYTQAPNVDADFDESQDRVDPHIQSDNWIEYIVAWRKEKLELYRDHATPGKEWLTGHKHLTYVIPLESKTRLSIYSFIDLTFCLACPPYPIRARSKGRALLYGPRKGTSIFVFKSKSRTRTTDWVWNLWRHLGGSLPPVIEIKVPAFDTRMKIDIPGGDTVDTAGAYAVFTRHNILALCRRALRRSRQHDMYIQQTLADGASLELAWRVDTVLDWVWQTEDVEGKPREWEILCGLALKQGSKPAHLELRLKQHVPTRLHLRDGTRLDEPFALEGFVERIRPNSQLKQALYLSTHDGYLFSSTPANAHLPMPPGPMISSKDADPLHASETRRGTSQVMNAAGVSDLRSILAVRRAFQQVPMQMEQLVANTTDSANWEDREEFWTHVERTDEDESDVGGEEGLAASQDKVKLRTRRCFELLLLSGRVIRFETHSCRDALEWITRLRQLVSYWRKRHQVDARQEMHLATHVAGRSRITSHKRRDLPDAPPDPPPDPDAALPDLSVFYNWCVLDGCRAILRSGRLFSRKGSRGMYKHVFFVLVFGHIVQFRITGKSSLHHRRHKSINLLDAYVCSGYLAAQHLPEGQYDPDSAPLARRYQDGLESDEREEDTLFILWYRGNTASLDQTLAAALDGSPGKMDVPPLAAKRKLAVCRTRSKLERDAWVWAINAEIDKTVRVAREREMKVREADELVSS